MIKITPNTFLVKGNQIREQAVCHSFSGRNAPDPADSCYALSAGRMNRIPVVKAGTTAYLKIAVSMF
jgi:hypothetical protein